MNLHDYLISRRLNVDLYSTVALSEQDREITFSLWNLSGQMVGYQLHFPDRSGNDRYFTHVTKPHSAVWGLETWDFSPELNVLFIVEGVFDACVLHQLGYPAVAVLGCNPTHLCPWLYASGRVVIAIGDGDDAGRMLNKLGQYHIPLPDGKDLGMLTNEEIEHLLNKGKDRDGKRIS